MPKHDDGTTVPDAALDDVRSCHADALTDGALMLAVAAGDSKAFSLLMGRHVPKMVALARRITLNASDADDVVQAAFLRVWVNAPRWNADGPAQFRTWLQKIVTNLAIDVYRRPKPLPFEAAGDPPDPRPSAQTDLEQSDEARRVREALEHLPPRQRAAAVLYYFEEMTAADIASTLDLSLGAAEALLVRARKGLRILLTPAGGPSVQRGTHDA